MDIVISQYKELINEMVITNYKRSYKNIESLNILKHNFETLGTIRRGLLMRFQNFPGDLSVIGITEEISRVVSEKAGRKLLEWTFDHYSDLFNFKAEALLEDINRFHAVGSNPTKFIDPN